MLSRAEINSWEDSINDETANVDPLDLDMLKIKLLGALNARLSILIDLQLDIRELLTKDSQQNATNAKTVNTAVKRLRSGS